MQRPSDCQLALHTCQSEYLSPASRNAWSSVRSGDWSRFAVLLVVSLGVVGALVVSASVVGQDPTSLGIRESQAFWKIAIQKIDDALATGNVKAAVQEWQAAYRAVMRAEEWEGLLEVGDAYRRIGEVAGRGVPFEAKAREIYRIALSSARRQECVDCLLRVAEAFAGLGDRERVEESFHLANLLAARDPEAEADVRAFASRFSDQFLDQASGREE